MSELSMELPQAIKNAIQELKTPEGRNDMALRILLIAGTKVLTKLTEAENITDKLVIALKDLQPSDIDIELIQKTSEFIHAAILKFMELTEK